MNVFTCKKLLMTKKKLPVRFTGQHFTIDKVLIKDAIRHTVAALLRSPRLFALSGRRW